MRQLPFGGVEFDPFFLQPKGKGQPPDRHAANVWECQSVLQGGRYDGLPPQGGSEHVLGIFDKPLVGHQPDQLGTGPITVFRLYLGEHELRGRKPGYAGLRLPSLLDVLL